MGERQHWVIGTLNRANYLRTLVPRHYDAEQTYFYAIPTESALQSLAALQYGMYPLYTGPILSPDQKLHPKRPPFGDEDTYL